MGVLYRENPMSSWTSAAKAAVPLDVAAVQLYGYIGTTHEQNSEAYSVHGILFNSYPE